MLIDYVDTEKRMVAFLEEKGRKVDWLCENLLRPTESEADLDSLLDEMKAEGKIHNQYGYIHLITKESEERRQNPKLRKNDATIANPWAWYAWMPESREFRMQIRDSFTREDGRMFKALAAVICNERPPRIGSRVTGPITEQEGRYITRVNEALLAFKEKLYSE